MGKLKYRQRRYDQAAGCFRESYRLHASWWSQLWLGKSLTQKGDFPEAERVLTSLVPNHPTVRKDLSWLYERQGHRDLALREVQTYLREFPEDAYAMKQQQRLLSQALEPDEVVSEVQLLHELGEQIDENLVPEYIQGLLRTGKADEARRAMEDLAGEVSPSVAVRTAWNCYRLQAYDLAFQLFHRTLSQNLQNAKFLSAYEMSARRVNAVQDVVDAYRQHTAQEPRMYGRIRRLARYLPD